MAHLLFLVWLFIPLGLKGSPMSAEALAVDTPTETSTPAATEDPVAPIEIPTVGTDPTSTGTAPPEERQPSRGGEMTVPTAPRHRSRPAPGHRKGELGDEQ